MARKNFPIAVIDTAPIPAASGTSTGVLSGDASNFRDTPFFATIKPSGVTATMSSAEIVEVTDITGDTLTITRTQRGTSAQSIGSGWLIYEGIYGEDLDALEADIATKADAAGVAASLATKADVDDIGFGKQFDFVVAAAGGDYTDIQAAIDALDDTDGGLIYIKAGTYTLTTPLSITTPNVQIVGQRGRTIITCGSAYNKALIKIDSNNTQLKDITVNGNAVNQTADDGTDNTFGSIVVLPSATGTKIINCQISSNYDTAIYSHSSVDLMIIDSIVSGSNTNWGVIELNACANVTIRGCTISGNTASNTNGGAVIAYGASSTALLNCIDNYFYNCQRVGIYVTTVGTGLQNVITGNRFNLSGVMLAIRITRATRVHENTINITITANSSGDVVGIQSSSASNSSISTNSIAITETVQSAHYMYGITSVSIDGNLIKDNNISITLYSSTSLATGIYNDSDNVIITGNLLQAAGGTTTTIRSVVGIISYGSKVLIQNNAIKLFSTGISGYNAAVKENTITVYDRGITSDGFYYVTGNEITQQGTNSNSSVNGIYIDANNCKVNENIIFNFTKEAIKLNSNKTGNSIVDNNIWNCGTAAYITLGSTCTNNIIAQNVLNTSSATITVGITEGASSVNKYDKNAFNTSGSGAFTARYSILTASHLQPPLALTTTTSTSTLTIDDKSDLFAISALAANLTIAAPLNPTDGRKVVVKIKDNGTARTITFNAIFKAVGVTLPTTTVINKVLYIGMFYDSAATKWNVIAVNQE